MDLSEVDAVRKIIEAHNAEISRCYAQGLFDSVAAVFTADAWQMPPNSPPLIGREAIRAFWAQATQWGGWQFSLSVQQVDVCGSIAVERGKYNLRFTAGPTAPPHMNSFEDWGNYLVYWRREEDGQWRIAADAPVSERPGPAAMAT